MGKWPSVGTLPDVSLCFLATSGFASDHIVIRYPNSADAIGIEANELEYDLVVHSILHVVKHPGLATVEIL
jgi:hypothetical protein